MVNKYWLAQVQSEQQKEMLAQLKSGQVIIQDGKIILNPEWIWKQEQARLRKKYQAIREAWKQAQAEKQAEAQWQAWWSQVEKQLEAAFKWKEGSM